MTLTGNNQRTEPRLLSQAELSRRSLATLKLQVKGDPAQALASSILVEDKKKTADKPAAKQTGPQVPLRWTLEKDDHQGLKVNILPDTGGDFVTLRAALAAEAMAPLTVPNGGRLALKLDDSSLAPLKQKYYQACYDSLTHIPLTALYNKGLMAGRGFALSLRKVGSQELAELLKKARTKKTEDTEAMAYETDYNLNLLKITAAPKGQIKALEQVAANLKATGSILGMDEYYSQENVLVRGERICLDLLQRFSEERAQLDYQLDYLASQLA